MQNRECINNIQSKFSLGKTQAIFPLSHYCSNKVLSLGENREVQAWNIRSEHLHFPSKLPWTSWKHATFKLVCVFNTRSAPPKTHLNWQTGKCVWHIIHSPFIQNHIHIIYLNYLQLYTVFYSPFSSAHLFFSAL